MSSALYAHNKEVLSKFLMLRGKQRKDASLKLRSETGLFVIEEDGIVFEIEMFWEEMLCLKRNVNLNKKNVMVDH